MNILYIGPNESEWAQHHCPGSLAGAKWSRGFQTALAKVCNLITLSHTYMYPWPKGRKIWVDYDERCYPQEWKCVSIQYPALRYIRELWWMAMYPLKAWRIIRERKIDAVVFYNCCEPWQRWTMRAIKWKFPRLLIFPIVLDGRDPIRDNWAWLSRAARYADGFIPLSWWMYENIPRHLPVTNVYHMDSGADGWRGVRMWKRDASGGEDINSSPASSLVHSYKLVHTGALDQWRGLDFMIDIVKQLTAKRRDVKFVFCGKTSEQELKRIFGNNPYVELPGFVPEKEMEKICNSADVLLNVRNPDHPDNILNYPSKLPHYLSFGRPVVSTCLASLSPDYAQVVEFPDDGTVDAYIRKVEEVLMWDDNKKERKYDEIKEWFEKRKRWDILVEGLVAWIGAKLNEENPCLK